MVRQEVYWIWFTTIGIRQSTQTVLCEFFDDIESIYFASEKDYNEIEGIPQNDIKLLLNKDLSAAKEIFEKTDILGGFVLTVDNVRYPDRLRDIVNLPYVLYVKGDLPTDEEIVTLGVVGTRKYSTYGEKVTKKMCYYLAKEGFTIVSGMARGIDTFAAIAALRAGRKTIAVLGSGLDVIYPPENVEVYKAISENGCIITEYPPGSQPIGFHFPERNRIIAGLSDALLVTEAPSKSGALITARQAFDIGRKIYAVPGNVFDVNSVGTNALIRAGVNIVAHPKDISSDFELQLKNIEKSEDDVSVIVNYPSGKRKAVVSLEETIVEFEKKKENTKNIEIKERPNISDSRYSNLSDEEKIIIELIIENEKITIDEIIRASELSASKVNTLLSFLEISGEVKRLAGNYYELNL